MGECVRPMRRAFPLGALLDWSLTAGRPRAVGKDHARTVDGSGSPYRAWRSRPQPRNAPIGLSFTARRHGPDHCGFQDRRSH